MINKLYNMYCHYSSYWFAQVPRKPGYGNYYLRGINNRYRKYLKN